MYGHSYGAMYGHSYGAMHGHSYGAMHGHSYGAMHEPMHGAAAFRKNFIKDFQMSAENPSREGSVNDLSHMFWGFMSAV